MKIYYIDDSFFAKTDVAHAMRYKLKVILEEQQVDCLLISSTGQYQREIEHFQDEFSDIMIYTNGSYQWKSSLSIFVDPCKATIDGLTMQALSQSYCIFDSETHECHRIYLNFFQQEETSIVSLIQEQIENILSSKDEHSVKYKH